MLDLDKIDYFEVFKNTIINPDHFKALPTREFFSNENDFGKIYQKTLTNVEHLNEERILTGETNRTTFETEYFIPYWKFFKSTLKIYQYKGDSIIRVRIASRILTSDTKLFFSKKYSLAIQFDTISKKFQYQVKFQKGRERITNLSFNTANFIKPFVDQNKLSEFAIFFLKSNSNEFILKSENIQFIESLFNNTGSNYVFYNLDNKKLSTITNPTIFYRYITGYKNLNKNFLKISIKKAAIISKYIKEEDQKKFFDVLEIYNPPDNKTLENQEILNGLRNRDSEIEEVVNYFKWYTKGDPSTIRDYIILTQELGEKVNLNISTPRRLKEEHDKLVKKQRALEIPEFKTHNKYKNVLVSNEELDIELIDNREQLAEESAVMNHCVYSYHDRINNGNCAIFSIKNQKNKKERWTLELKASYLYKVIKYQVSITNLNVNLNNIGEESLQTDPERKQYSYYIGQLRGYNNDADPTTRAPQWVRNGILNQLINNDPNNQPESVEDDMDNEGFNDW